MCNPRRLKIDGLLSFLIGRVRHITDWKLDNRHALEYVLRLLKYYIGMRIFVRSVKQMNNSNIIMYTTEDGPHKNRSHL